MASIREPADIHLTGPAGDGTNFLFAARE